MKGVPVRAGGVLNCIARRRVIVLTVKVQRLWRDLHYNARYFCLKSFSANNNFREWYNSLEKYSYVLESTHNLQNKQSKEAY